MTTLFQPIFDANQVETGMVISAIDFKPDTITKKKIIEDGFSQIAHKELYPREGLNIFSNTENDVASITVLRNLNNLKSFEKKYHKTHL